MQRLRNIEDLTLAMADEEPQDPRSARWVLRTYLERRVSAGEVTSVLGRLANLGLIRWRVASRRRIHVRRRATVAEQRSGQAWFVASPEGLAYLALPRDVT